MNGKNVEHFRAMLQNIIDSTDDSEESYRRGIASVTRAIKGDFDRMFPPEVYQADTESMRLLAEKYCTDDPTLCPICAHKLIPRKGKRGMFLGCTQFPACKGSRAMSGSITINESLKTFVADQIYEEQLALESHMGRFQDLELDED